MSVLQKENEKFTEAPFSAVYEIMKQEQDEENAFKVLELYEKYMNDEFIICFSGHFSAGKSSIINYLLEKDVLPKSPIPTSANIVKITSGEGVAKVYFKDDDPVQYKEPYDIDIIKDYCMDRDTIQQIEINTKEHILPSHTALFDSPGIDAADDADRLMTESAIHLIDLLFYVMDYNHVQSEVNLYFLQEMQKLNIPIYIVINQVDKHNESELSFFDYDQRIKQTFDQWGIEPQKIYYTSILDQSHPENQLIQLKKEIFDKLSKPEDILPKLKQSMQSVIHAHQTFLKNKYERQLSTDDKSLLSQEEIKEADVLEHKLAALNQKRAAFDQVYNEEVQTTLKNAYLMPRKTRDLAESFLLSQEKDFKVGIFQAKKKTKEEQKSRLIAFEEELKETMETTIQWKLREKIISLLQTYDLAEEALLKQIQEMQIAFGKEDLTAHLKEGAKVNGNYVLNYTNDVSAGVKAKYRSEMNRLWKPIGEHAQKMFNQEENEIMEQLTPYKEKLKNKEKDAKVEEELTVKQEAVIEQWEHPTTTEENIKELDNAVQKKNNLREETLPEQVKQPNQPVAKTEEESQETSDAIYDVERITSSIEQVTNEISDMKGFQSIVQELEKKQSRLENRELTIALFGTFSAGKSSFSNALFGERILPVSPNPTTAVINRISPVSSDHSHGTVHISIKSTEALISDLELITKHLTKQSMYLDEWINWIRKNRIDEHEELSKTYQSYLHAVITGYEDRKDHLGDKITISLEEFADYVTDETIACFISEVDLYYDCALTRKGITLVDTPGADSVNARHTNVAFDYIKEADAILYVTYYNHAITRGDRDFLIQLGRVKEAFEMDKMFFIVNASDLAENQSDLDLVVDYVTDQLLQFGIRNPKIFPVSSKLSLEDKLQNKTLNNEMQDFEEAFYKFIDKDLIALTVESALWDMDRAEKMLDEFIQSLELNEAEREHKIASLQTQQKKAVRVIDQANMSVFEDRIMDRIDRQLHFVLERLYINFHDMFTEFFNPSTINTSGKEAQKQLEHSRNRFIDYIGYEQLQEVRAVSLRIEAYMRELLKEAFDMNQEEARRINASFIFPSQSERSFTTPEYDQAFEQLNPDVFQKALKIYKNMKSFFEQNDREKMEQAFYDILKKETELYLDNAKQLMKTSYGKAWAEQVSNMKEDAKNEIISIVKEHTDVLQTNVDTGAMKTAQKNIQHTIETVS